MFHDNEQDEYILDKYQINKTIQKALQPRVDLPSGGYIIIEPTEALTVIDVNSGSFTRSANSRQTVLWTNCEAAVEISRQMKLRNIGGVLVIDFIDMESRRDQFQLLEQFSLAIKDDTVFINFKSSESIRDIKILLNSNEALLKEEDSLSFIYYHIFTESDSQGVVPILLDYIDLAGNVGETIDEKTKELKSLMFKRC